jgi:N-dimethylarginine dimethylaminohydrolase
MLTVRVDDEFGKLRAAIVHDGSNVADVTMDDWRALLPPHELVKHPEAGPSSKARLVEQHGRLRRLLTDNEVNLVAPETQSGAIGQVFTRDPCFAIGEALFVGSLFDEWRLSEPAGLGNIRARVAPLPNGEALYDPGKLPEVSQSDLANYFDRLIALDLHEAARHLAANIFWLDHRRVVSGVAAKKTNALLGAMGFEVIELDFSDLVAQCGGCRCVVCPIERD